MAEAKGMSVPRLLLYSGFSSKKFKKMILEMYDYKKGEREHLENLLKIYIPIAKIFAYSSIIAFIFTVYLVLAWLDM